MSYRMKIDPKSRKAARFISDLQKKVQKAFISTGKTQQEIAVMLGVDRSVINRRLAGGVNLTARSIAELAYAFDKEIDIEFVDPKKAKRPNIAVSADRSLTVRRPNASTASGATEAVGPDSTFRLAKMTP